MKPQELIKQMNWRASIKTFDPTKKVDEEKWQAILESLRLSASSFGLQTWGFVNVVNPEIREQLVAHSWNQRQVKDASHLIVLCSLREVSEKNVDEYIEDTMKTRGLEREPLKGYEGVMKGFLQRLSPTDRDQWMRNQVYIALGNLLTTCAVLGVDSCPMEGFIPAKYDELLNLADKNLKSVVICPVGYRDPTDKYSDIKKVRFPAEKIFFTV